jgi:uracil phosphoribosyltransferase
MQLYLNFSCEKSNSPMTFVLNQNPSIANHMLRELRDKDIQRDSMRFRNNIEKLGSIMAYEISKVFQYHPETISTPLGSSVISVLNQQPVLITVLRAGLPYFQGFQKFFDQAECGFIGAFRNEGNDEITISLNYLATPSLQNREVILIDPMLATGKSFVKSFNALVKYGKPAHVHIASLVAVPDGIQFIKQNLNVPHTVWTWALDEGLNEQSYIVPGLGDAGDLCYGTKL